MNNKEFVNELAKHIKQPAPTASKTLSDTLRILEEHFIQGDVVSISSFGTFEVKKKMERISVNPTTGKRFLVPPKLVLGFKQSNVLKEKFNAG